VTIPDPDDKLVRTTLSAALVAELDRLIGRTVDDELAESERVRLNEILGNDKAARVHYLRYISLHSMLMTTAGNHARHEVEQLRRRLLSLSVASTIELDSSAAAPHFKPISFPTAAATMRVMRNIAAILLVILLPASVYYIGGSLTGKNHTAEPLKAGSANTARTEQIEPIGHNVARVSYVSPTTRWQHPNDSYAVDSSVRAGNTLFLAQGEVELLYDTGVKLILYGPAEFLVRDIGGVLHCGGLVASVPEAGHGFTIETPHGKVIDLGTEFGVVVDDFGVSEVSVFEGKVEAFPTGLADAQTKKIELTKGRALQWSSDTLVSMDADRNRFASSLSNTSPVSSVAMMSLASVDDAFRDTPMDRAQWTPLGDVETSSQGLVMKGEQKKSRQPCIVSTGEFDPADGPITVICDIRFPQLQEGDAPSFAILTRSTDNRSDIDAPWKDILATCVRCNFKSDENSLDGMLETSTKYEPDRELTKMSWRGFQRPQSDVAYRLVMRDDGVNVSFTVSPVDNPSVVKTVTCRSLFRGYKNHVALEGWNDGVTVVDHVKVFQDPPFEAQARLSTREPLLQASEPTPYVEIKENGLANLVPADAQLVLEDHFDGAEIDTDRWESLGDVTLRNGRVSLGQPIKAVHINTWNPRPYLITRRRFTPGEEKLFVLGRIEFDENFLQGYGGSFAVMTRCDNHLGNGPGWEYSILRSGVRSNFWPAAPGHDHNLEIHEKPTPNTISLLAGTGLEINPRSRSYFFCVEDDGQMAKITIQDADNPSIHKSLIHPTSSASPRAGFVGFESCWGSPVLLDDVQIYSSQHSSLGKDGE
jgi:hypothetical protein